MRTFQPLVRIRACVRIGALCVLVAACGSDGDGDGVAATDPVGDGTVGAVVTTSSEPGPQGTAATATIPLGTHVDGGLVTEDAVWAVVTETDMLYRVDPDTNTAVQEISVPGIGYRFDIGHGAAWVTDFGESVVRRVELDGGTVVAEIPTGQGPEGVSVTNDAVWVANHHDGTVTRIDPTTNEVVATIEVGPAGPAGPQPIVASDDRVWVGVPNLGQVVVIDATTNAIVAQIESSATCGEMRLIDESVWVTNCFESDDVAVIEQSGAEARGLKAGGPAGRPLLIDGDVWLPTISLEEPVGQFVRVDPATLEILDSVVADPPSYLAAEGFGSIWQFSWDTGAVIRLPVDGLVQPAD